MRREGGRQTWNWRKKREEGMVVVGLVRATTKQGVGVGRVPMSLVVGARVPVTSLSTGAVLALVNGQCRHPQSHQD